MTAVGLAAGAVNESPLDATIVLRDGAVVRIRAVAKADAHRLKAFHDRLSPLSRYMRFQRAIREVSLAQCERMSQADGIAETGLIACVLEPEGARVIADARFVLVPGTREAELAIAVADDWQQRGLGDRLLVQLLRQARNRGVDLLFGEALNDNVAVRKLAQRQGARLQMTRWGTTRVSIELLPLTQEPPPIVELRECRFEVAP